MANWDKLNKNLDEGLRKWNAQLLNTNPSNNTMKTESIIQMLTECKNQFNYLNGRFGDKCSATTNLVLSKLAPFIRDMEAQHQEQPKEVNDPYSPTAKWVTSDIAGKPLVGKELEYLNECFEKNTPDKPKLPNREPKEEARSAEEKLKKCLMPFDTKEEKVSEILFNVYPDEMKAIINLLKSTK